MGNINCAVFLILFAMDDKVVKYNQGKIGRKNVTLKLFFI